MSWINTIIYKYPAASRFSTNVDNYHAGSGLGSPCYVDHLYPEHLVGGLGNVRRTPVHTDKK